jgi:hypothetical protein
MPFALLVCLRDWAKQRVLLDLPVVWYSDGARYRAEPWPDKGPSSWRVTASHWEFSRQSDYLLAEIRQADAIGIDP